MSSPKKFQQQSGALNLLFGLRQESHLAAWCLGCNQQSLMEEHLFSSAASPARGRGCVAKQRIVWGVTHSWKHLSEQQQSFLLESCEPASPSQAPALGNKAQEQFLSAHQRPSPCSSLTSKASQETSSTFHILFKQFPFLLLSGSEDHPFMQ